MTDKLDWERARKIELTKPRHDQKRWSREIGPSGAPITDFATYWTRELEKMSPERRAQCEAWVEQQRMGNIRRSPAVRVFAQRERKRIETLTDDELARELRAVEERRISPLGPFIRAVERQVLKDLLLQERLCREDDSFALDAAPRGSSP